jgi:quercetin dioxygenase-like cupin family protein
MTTTTGASLVLQLPEQIAYSDKGIVSKVLWKDQSCQYTLFCLAAGTEISEHTATRNATVQVIEGQGILTLNRVDIPLKLSTFVLMPAHAPHALKAETNLAFLLTLSNA